MPDLSIPPSALPRGIAVVDIGFTNCKVLLFDQSLTLVDERKIHSPHHDGPNYREIDVEPMLQFAVRSIAELDQVLPVDCIVPCAHGACIVSLRADGTLSVPIMDYTSEPPLAIEAAYKAEMPDFAESYSPHLPMALLHGMQLFWQSRILPEAFAQTHTILPLMQYVSHRLGGRATTEVSSMSCQSHLVDMRSGGPSTLSQSQGWSAKFAPLAKAWDVIGALHASMRAPGMRGRGNILAGVHDSNANFLRYLSGGLEHFTLLSTGTWIIGFDTDADITQLNPDRDIVANKNVFGKTVASCRFFGGKEFEMLAEGARAVPQLDVVGQLMTRQTFALPSFSDSGGPMPGTGGKGRIAGPALSSDVERVTLASLYCALMVAESLDALHSEHSVVIDGPFSQNDVFLGVLAALRPGQTVLASQTRDGTAAGAACLALMPDGKLPQRALALRHVAPAALLNLADYQQAWRRAASAPT